ncbi:MAG: phosphatase [Clostridia bacterium]|nr:phosphatase [Clostridia bacterium]
MNIVADLHTHTMVSHHAYSTMRENIILAGQKGLKLIATTDHAYGSPDSANNWHFGSMWVCPRIMEGVYHLRGAEANIMKMDGSIDLNDRDEAGVDLLIASLHGYVIRPVNPDAHTACYEAILKKPYVDIIGHPADPGFLFDEERIVRRCAETGKMIEINAHAMLKSPPTVEINRRLLRLCKKHDAVISVGSDAHVCYEIGNFDFVKQMLEEEDFPEELVFNSRLDRIIDYINAKPNVKDKLPKFED